HSCHHPFQIAIRSISSSEISSWRRSYSFVVRCRTVLSLCLARLERSCAGDFGYETGGALGAGGGQRSEDLPGSRAFGSFAATGDLTRDDRWVQVAFGQVVGD